MLGLAGCGGEIEGEVKLYYYHSNIKLAIRYYKSIQYFVVAAFYSEVSLFWSTQALNGNVTIEQQGYTILNIIP